MNPTLAMMFLSGPAGNCPQMQKAEGQRLVINKKKAWGEEAAAIAAVPRSTWPFGSRPRCHPQHGPGCDDHAGTVRSAPAEPAGEGGRGGGSVPGRREVNFIDKLPLEWSAGNNGDPQPGSIGTV